MNSTTNREMWQVARKGARPLTLATSKKKKNEHEKYE